MSTFEFSSAVQINSREDKEIQAVGREANFPLGVKPVVTDGKKVSIHGWVKCNYFLPQDKQLEKRSYKTEQSTVSSCMI